jgi:hypothetical protein
MKNAELYFHAQELASSAVKQQKKDIHFDLFRSFLDHPKVLIDIQQRTLTITLNVISCGVVGLGAIEREFNSVITKMNFRNLLPSTLHSFVLDKSTLLVNPSKLQQERNEQLSFDCNCDDQDEAQINYEHNIVYKIPSKAKEQLLLKTMKDSLILKKESDTASSRIVPLKQAEAITFTLTQGDQEYSCYLDTKTQKIGFTKVLNADGEFNDKHSVTWDLWTDPCLDIRPMLDNLGSTGTKALLKRFLVKGVSISNWKFYSHDCSHQAEDYSAYKQITIRTDIGKLYSSFCMYITFKKTGEIKFTNLKREDITEHPSCKLIAEKLQTVRSELFKNNQNYASAFFSNHSDDQAFLKNIFADWQNPFSYNGASIYFR